MSERRAVTHIDLPSGAEATTVVSRSAILVQVGERACLAHNRWFSKEQAAEMIRALEVFVQ